MSSVITKVYNDKIEASKYVAGEVAKKIGANNANGQSTVLGLATGSSPIEMYKELIRLHKEDGLSFKNVITLPNTSPSNGFLSPTKSFS